MGTTILAIAGVFGIGLIVGVVVLMTAEAALMAVARTAARDVGGSFWAGILWQLIAAPMLALLLLACTITVIGILAIPLVTLAWALAYAGAVTLGSLAVAVVIGRALAGRGVARTERAAALRGLTLGLLALSLVWFGTALTEAVPVARGVARLMAVAFNWTVATIGLGAVVKSPIGVVRLRVQFERFRREPPPTTPAPVWQTPTPVQGVAAARRPAPSAGPDGSSAEP